MDRYVLVLVLYSKRHTSGVEIANHVVLLWDVIDLQATLHCFRKMEMNRPVYDSLYIVCTPSKQQHHASSM